MTENIIHWSNEAPLLGYGESDSAGAWLKFRVTPEDLEHFRGLKGTVFYLTTVEIANDGTPVVKATSEESQDDKNTRAARMMDAVKTAEPVKPYGHQASELYRSGFFYALPVLEAIGTDVEFLDWIRAQPCAVTGERDYHKDEATGVVTERCEAAHVRRIADGAGTAEKPPYSAIPLVHAWHDAQTRYGESVFADLSKNVYDRESRLLGVEVNLDAKNAARLGKEWMDKTRNKYVVDWASHTLASLFGKQSMGFVDPDDVVLWATARNIPHYLPKTYTIKGAA
jgi:hypothetical protein